MKIAETNPSDLRERSRMRTFLSPSSPFSWSTGSLPPSRVIATSEDEPLTASASASRPLVSTGSLLAV